MTLTSISPPFIFEDDQDPEHVYRGIKDHEIKLLEKIGDIHTLVDFEILDERVEVGGSKIRLARMKRVPADIRIQELTKKQAKKLLCDQIDLCVDVLKCGVCLSDISESNIIYWAGKSYFIDLNAFADPVSRRGMPYAYVKMSYMVNRYLGDKTCIGSSVNADHKTIRGYKDWTAHNWTPDQDINLWQRFQEYVHNYPITEAKKTHWSDEYAHDEEKLRENKKMKIVADMLKQVKGYSVLDIGTNKGYYLDIVKDKFDRLIGFDCDDRCINLAEQQCGDDKTTFVKFGIEDCFGDRTKREERYRSDVVLALAVTHHFATNRISAQKAATAIAKMANKTILIEDIDNGHMYRGVFEAAGFKRVDRRDSDPCRRKLTLWSKS